jgi:hypothetical protein
MERPSLTASATPPLWNTRVLHDHIRRVLSSDGTAETIPTRRRRRTANVGELNAEAGETVNFKWTTIRLHGGRSARSCEVLTCSISSQDFAHLRMAPYHPLRAQAVLRHYPIPATHIFRQLHRRILSVGSAVYLGCQDNHPPRTPLLDVHREVISTGIWEPMTAIQ